MYWRYLRLTVIVASILVVALYASACMASRPALRANITSGANQVPLDATLKITADSALITQALLQRLDVPSDPIELSRTANGAELAVKLEPDAKYQISAVAEPATKTALPWEAAPSAQISLEQVFSTVETPLLEDADTTRTITREKPLELRFSQPLAKADVVGANAKASISKTDPRILAVEIPDPTPGADLSIEVTDAVGTDGVAAPDTSVALHVPSAIRLTGVSGKGISNRIGLATDQAVTLDWNRPVTTIRYQIDDKPTTWTGSATDSLQLPIKADAEKPQTVTVVDALGADGGWTVAQQSFEIMTAAPMQLVAMWPVDGEANVTPTSPPVFRFSEEVADPAAAEAAITFDPPVAGHFDWLAPNRVRFVADEAFPSNSSVTVKVDGNPRRIRGVSGGYLDDAVKATYTTGKLKVIDVSLSKQMMTLLEDGEPVWTAAVATGVPGAPTPPGDYQVQYKMPVARFRGVNPNGSHYDIPDVHWVMPFMGDYTIHGAYWRPVFGRTGSAGCISLSDPNAKHVYDWAEEGTPLHVHA